MERYRRLIPRANNRRKRVANCSICGQNLPRVYIIILTKNKMVILLNKNRMVTPVHLLCGHASRFAGWQYHGNMAAARIARELLPDIHALLQLEALSFALADTRSPYIYIWAPGDTNKSVNSMQFSSSPTVHFCIITVAISLSK